MCGQIAKECVFLNVFNYYNVVDFMESLMEPLWTTAITKRETWFENRRRSCNLRAEKQTIIKRLKFEGNQWTTGLLGATE